MQDSTKNITFDRSKKRPCRFDPLYGHCVQFNGKVGNYETVVFLLLICSTRIKLTGIYWNLLTYFIDFNVIIFFFWSHFSLGMVWSQQQVYHSSLLKAETKLISYRLIVLVAEKVIAQGSLYDL